jgi:thioredoxin-dependent adenylylsulfate APS reductase
LQDLNAFEVASASETLAWAIATFGEKFGIATSFQKEGMAIVDMAARLSPGVRIFTLDTGRLPEETYRIMETVRTRYGTTIEVVAPNHEEVERMVAAEGPDLFYRSVEGRQRCCEVRKVRPLARKLLEFEAWATGLRRDQSETRSALQRVERVDGRLKINPLVDWTPAEVDRYIREHDVPLHPLYARGYASIGCAPCTRAVGPEEDPRAGRWWWEQDVRKECGIHFAVDGSVSRITPTRS